MNNPFPPNSSTTFSSGALESVDVCVEDFEAKHVDAREAGYIDLFIHGTRSIHQSISSPLIRIAAKLSDIPSSRRIEYHRAPFHATSPL